jgi:radical SAM superfamily enzyme YgiQ (UPF0313 family)
MVSSLRKYNLPVEFLDLCFSESPIEDLQKELNKTKPDIVGFSIRNIDNVVMVNPQFYLDEVKQMIDICKKAGCIVIIGGPAVGILKEKAFCYLEPNYAIVGEGENSFPMLIKALEEKNAIDKIPGVIGYQKGIIVSEKQNPIADISDIPLPAIDQYDTRYFSYNKLTPMGIVRSKAGVQTKRGCPFKCIYYNRKI